MRKHILATTLLIPATRTQRHRPARARGSALPTPAREPSSPGSPEEDCCPAPPRSRRCLGRPSYSGQNVWRQTVSEKGRPIGQLDVYYKSGNKGTLIACFKHVGATKGKRTHRGVDRRGQEPDGHPARRPGDLVAGNFRSYAGPAVVGGANGQCVVAAGSIKYAGKTYLVTSPVLDK